jgi:hypothetical protein
LAVALGKRMLLGRRHEPAIPPYNHLSAQPHEEMLADHPLKKAVLRRTLCRVALAIADRVIGYSNHLLDAFLADKTPRSGTDVIRSLGID